MSSVLQILICPAKETVCLIIWQLSCISRKDFAKTDLSHGNEPSVSELLTFYRFVFWCFFFFFFCVCVCFFVLFFFLFFFCLFFFFFFCFFFLFCFFFFCLFVCLFFCCCFVFLLLFFVLLFFFKDEIFRRHVRSRGRCFCFRPDEGHGAETFSRTE